MFTLSKIAGFLTSPLAVGFLGLIVGGILLLAKRRRAGIVVSIVSLLFPLSLSIPAVGYYVSGALESRYPVTSVDETPTADAIVVLGGALRLPAAMRQHAFDIGPAGDRVWHAAMLYRAARAPKIYVSAGGARNEGCSYTEADAISQMLVGLGVPETAIVLERASRNTTENASFTTALLKDANVKRILLVTSALHMPRAMINFENATRAHSIEVIAASTDIEVEPDADFEFSDFLPDANALARTTRAVKEYVGLAALWLKG
jgi:uncharacterized SAM-binding protein YcdF (DUF218 family)